MSDQNILDNNNPSGPVKVGKYTIRVDRDLCIGAATCLAIAPKAYSLDSDAKAIIIDSADQETVEALLDSAKGCPTSAIIITDENGKQIFPKE